MFGAVNVFIISFMGRRRAELYGNYLRQPGGFCETTGLPGSNVHFCTDRDKFPLLDRHRITYFVDDRQDVMDMILRMMVSNRVAQPPKIYLGPKRLFIVPTVRATGVADSLEPYRRFVMQCRGLPLQLCPNLGLAVDAIAAHHHSVAEWTEQL
jgi:hypothetical protein